MSGRIRRGKAGFTLAEIIASLALVAVAGLFLAQMFALSDRLTERAASLDRAAIACTTFADRWKSGRMSGIVDLYPESARQVQESDQGFWRPLSADMGVCAPEDAEYVAVWTVTGAETSVADLNIRILDADSDWQSGTVADSDVLFELTASQYQAGGDGT